MSHLGGVPLPGRVRPSAALGVLDITEWYGDTSGGIRTYLHEKMRHVDGDPSLRQVLVVPGAEDGWQDTAGTRLYRLHGPPIPRQRPYRFMLATRSVDAIVRHERPDVIEIGSPFVVPWIVRHATRQLDVPLVCYHHTDLPGMFTPQVGRFRRVRRVVNRTLWRYLRVLDRCFVRTLVASPSAARDLAAAGIDRVTSVPLGVDLATFSPARRAHAAETRRRHALPEGPLCGFAGRFAREKALDVVLDAWPEVERRTGARLVLIGAGPMAARLAAHPYGPRVLFRPFQPERAALADLLAALDLYVAPGPIETFGLSAVEAMACGTPLLSVDRGGVADHVHASGAGRVYDIGEPASLAEQAVALLQGDLAALGRAASAHAVREHAWPAVFARLFAVYRELRA